jgi:hypothetical protein
MPALRPLPTNQPEVDRRLVNPDALSRKLKRTLLEASRKGGCSADCFHEWDWNFKQVAKSRKGESRESRAGRLKANTDLLRLLIDFGDDIARSRVDCVRKR